MGSERCSASELEQLRGRTSSCSNSSFSRTKLKEAFAADYVTLGGGNAKHVDPLPEGVARGGN